jgi:hypothetical protein
VRFAHQPGPWIGPADNFLAGPRTLRQYAPAGVALSPARRGPFPRSGQVPFHRFSLGGATR